MVYLRFGKIISFLKINVVCLKVVGIKVSWMKEKLESWEEEFRF